jgi:hypothetical protein
LFAPLAGFVNCVCLKDSKFVLYVPKTKNTSLAVRCRSSKQVIYQAQNKKKLPRLAPFAGGMKLATQISPLLYLFQNFHILADKNI